MKNVIISADGEQKVYAVPDMVADHLSAYCMEFCTNWIHNDPQAKKYRTPGGAVCYTEDDFIEYLNTYLFPNEKSVLVENLGWVNIRKLPAPYRDYPRFNF